MNLLIKIGIKFSQLNIDFPVYKSPPSCDFTTCALIDFRLVNKLLIELEGQERTDFQRKECVIKWIWGELESGVRLNRKKRRRRRRCEGEARSNWVGGNATCLTMTAALLGCIAKAQHWLWLRGWRCVGRAGPQLPHGELGAGHKSGLRSPIYCTVSLQQITNTYNQPKTQGPSHFEYLLQPLKMSLASLFPLFFAQNQLMTERFIENRFTNKFRRSGKLWV